MRFRMKNLFLYILQIPETLLVSTNDITSQCMISWYTVWTLQLWESGLLFIQEMTDKDDFVKTRE